MTFSRGPCSWHILPALPLIIVAVAIPLRPQESASDPTARLLTEIIRVNTANPPGNEEQLDSLLAGKFQPLGFEVEIVRTPQPGKAHFLARLRGDGSKPPVLLAAHSDTVGVEREKWTLDPFAGEVRGGYVYGRGAIDFKGGLAVFARAVMMLAENKVPLARDVIFLSEADEEGGSYNTSWLAENHWDKINCEFALNEGGWIIRDEGGKVRYVSISTADKISVSAILHAKGTSTHSSMPLPDNAIFRLSRAMAKLGAYETKPSLIASTRQFFSTLAKTSPEPEATWFRNLVGSNDPKLVEEADREISRDPLLHAIMRNTIAPVFLNAGFRGNVIPGSADATINLRLIPGADPKEVAKELAKVIDDPGVEVRLATTEETRKSGLTPANEELLRTKPSPDDTELFRALAQSARAVFPGVEVTSYLFQAGTDAQPWRSRGVPVYGIYPYPISPEDLKRMHGNDERVPIESLEQGARMIYQTLVQVAGRKTKQVKASALKLNLF